MKHLIRKQNGGLAIGTGQPDDRVLDTSPNECAWLRHAEKMLAEHEERLRHQPRMFGGDSNNIFTL